MAHPRANRLSNLAMALVLLVFGLLSIMGLSQHELWLDEAHHWLLARDSTSLAGLIHNARYDGHPLLWNLLLFFISRFSPDLIGMQVLHLGIAITTAWLVLRYAPFPRIWKVLFVFGYFPLYEYNWLARSYGLGILLLFTACALYRNRARHYPLLGLILALLANVHVLFLVLAFVFGLAIGADFLRNSRIPVRSNVLTGSLLLVVGILLSVLQVLLLNYHFHRFNADLWLNFQLVSKDLLMIEQAFVPIPDLANGHFWNSNLLVTSAKPLAFLVAILLWLWPIVLFSGKRHSLWLFYGGALGVIAILHIAQHAGVRYFGVLYGWLIAVQWISADESLKQVCSKSRVQQWFFRLERVAGQPFWYVIGMLQIFASLIACSLDWSQPFSEAKAAVRYLKEHQLDDKLVAVSSFNAAPPISAYLGKKIYYPDQDSLGSFCLWNTIPVSPDSLLTRLGRQAQNQDVILLLNQPLEVISQSVRERVLYPATKVKMKLLNQFDHSIVRSESFYIYQVSTHP